MKNKGDKDSLSKFEAILVKRRESGDWTNLVSADKRRLVRRKVCAEAGFCTSVLQQNLSVKQSLKRTEQALRNEGILRGTEETLSMTDRFAALESAAERIASIENTISELELALQKLEGKADNYRSEFLEILQARGKLNPTGGG